MVRLSDNTVFDVNKRKMLKEHVGKLAEVSGEAKLESGTMKLQTVKPAETSSIPAGYPARLLLDVQAYQAKRSASTYEQVRHELAMMPYITTYDFISYTMVGSNVILTGWTVRQTNRNDAYNRVKSVEGVDKIINNIEILPMGRSDMEIRAGVRARAAKNPVKVFLGKRIRNQDRCEKRKGHPAWHSRFQVGLRHRECPIQYNAGRISCL